MSGELAAAVAKAMRELRGVAHDARNKDQGYNYTSTEAVTAAARQVLAANGLAFFRCGAEVICDREPVEAKTRSGSTYTAEGGWLVSSWLLMHSSGEERAVGPHKFPWATGPGRPRDKALGAAYTSSLGEMLRSLLLIDRPDEPECAEGRNDLDDEQPAQRARSEAPKQAAPKPAAQTVQPEPPAWARADAKLAVLLEGGPLEPAAVNAALNAIASLNRQTVPSENGASAHTVTRQADGGWVCGCQGYVTHKKCRHCAVAELVHRATVLGDKYHLSGHIDVLAPVGGLGSYDLKALAAELETTDKLRPSSAGPWAWPRKDVVK